MPYPIVDDPKGLLRTQHGISQIKSDLLVLLLTNQGERVMLPNFGANLRAFLFEPNDETLAEQIRQNIIEQLRLWEPRVVINDLIVTTTPEDEDLNPDENNENDGAILFISILFSDLDNINEVEELKLQTFLPAG